MKLFSKNSNLCDHDTSIRTDRLTDERTDRRLAVAIRRTCLSAMSLKNALSCLFRRTNNVAETNEIDLMDYSHKNILIDLKKSVYSYFIRQMATSTVAAR